MITLSHGQVTEAQLGDLPEVTQLPSHGADAGAHSDRTLEPGLCPTAATVSQQPCLLSSHLQAALS